MAQGVFIGGGEHDDRTALAVRAVMRPMPLETPVMTMT